MAKKTVFEDFRPHRVAVLAFDGVILGDLATAVEFFDRARASNGRPAYEVRVTGAAQQVGSRHVGLAVPHRLRSLQRADTVVVPGLELDMGMPSAVLRALAKLLERPAARRPRLVSICTGAFILAAAGVLDGRRVTTHWEACTQLAASFPRVEVDPDVLFVDHGDVLTSAGATAGIDLCLHIIRKDLGATEAARLARRAVTPLERDGGQAQYIEHPLPRTDGTSLAEFAKWIVAHLDRDLTLPALARRAGMSTRSLSRHVKAQLGVTPAQWVAHLRVHRAQELLEQTDLSVEQIAETVGFRSSAALRHRFTRTVKVPPSRWRAQFASPTLA